MNRFGPAGLMRPAAFTLAAAWVLIGRAPSAAAWEYVEVPAKVEPVPVHVRTDAEGEGLGLAGLLRGRKEAQHRSRHQNPNCRHRRRVAGDLPRGLQGRRAPRARVSDALSFVGFYVGLSDARLRGRGLGNEAKGEISFNGRKGVFGGEAWHDSEEGSYHNCSDYSATWPWSIEENDCKWIGNHAFYGYGDHMCAQDLYHINKPWGSDYAAMTFHNYGDGYAGPHWNDDC